MSDVRRFRFPALLCAVAVLLAELVARPFVEMGISDDFSYIRTTQRLAETGHLYYNGWATAMVGWQLYLGAAFVKLFGFSFTTVRMSTLLVACVTAFVLQRCLVRCGIGERNAVLATLTLVLSPLYLLLTATFMTDIQGLFALVVCLHACLRALQSGTDRGAIAWLCLGVAVNAVCGSARQIAWLGVLVMVPSTLWMLRARRQVVLAGAAAVLVAVVFIFSAMHWFAHQAYSIPEHLISSEGNPRAIPVQMLRTLMDVPFLLLPLFLCFLAVVRGSSRKVLAGLAAGGVVFAGLLWRFPFSFLEPTQGDWAGPYGWYQTSLLKGAMPMFLGHGQRLVLSGLAMAGLLCVVAAVWREKLVPGAKAPSPLPRNGRAEALPYPKAGELLPYSGAPLNADGTTLSWHKLCYLLLPYTAAYCVLLIPRSEFALYDRYLLGLLFVAVVFVTRMYQERVSARLPVVMPLLVLVFAGYSVACTYNMGSFYRARVALAAEMRAAGVPDTEQDNGLEYNAWTELQHSDYLNDHRILLPPGVIRPVALPEPVPAIPGDCKAVEAGSLPHVHARYGVSFDPDICLGQAAFAPVTYSRWPMKEPGVLYVVKYPAAR